MAKWKCEICGNEFENFHAQGFDNKIYCPLCYFKKENQELKEDISFCLHSIKQEMEMSTDSRTRNEMTSCYYILKRWNK